MSQKWEDSKEVVDERWAGFLCRELAYISKTVLSGIQKRVAYPYVVPNPTDF
jgi:hypothetical protein